MLNELLIEQYLSNLNNEIKNNTYYKNGDSLTATFQVGGYITSSTKDFVCMIYLPKSLKKINRITVSGGLFSIRTTTGGYIDGQGNGIDYNANGFTTSANKVNDNAIYILFRKSTTFSNATNNTPAGGSISNLTLTFNE